MIHRRLHRSPRRLHRSPRRLLAGSAAGALLLATLGSAAGLHVLGGDPAEADLWMVDQDLAAVIAASTSALEPDAATSDTVSTEVPITPTIDTLSVAQPGTNAASTIDTSAFDGDAPRGIPAMVLTSYQRAAKTIATTDAACALPWWLLAGIGKIESGHAAGGRVDGQGTTRGRIVGPRLDGTLAGTAVIRDTDGGRLDGDGAFDRAVGPMQFLPGTWLGVGADGNADGRRDPHNVFDASLASGRYLCAGDAALTTDAAMTRAVLRYNHSDAYARDVLSWGHAYRDGALVVPEAEGAIPVSRAVPQPSSTRVPSPTTTTLARPTTSTPPTTPPATVAPTSPPPGTPPGTPSPSTTESPTPAPPTPSPTSEPSDPATTPTPDGTGTTSTTSPPTATVGP